MFRKTQETHSQQETITRRAWLEDAWQSCEAPLNKDVTNTREALRAAKDAGAPSQMTLKTIKAFLKKERVGGGDLGKPRINVSSTVKWVRLWALRDFDETRKAPNEVVGLAFRGMAWRTAATEVQQQRWNRNVLTRSAVEKTKAIANK